jgi:hypothetical protein
MTNLPAPRRDALEIIEITNGLTCAALDLIAPGAGTALRGAVSMAVRKKILWGEEQLLREVKRHGISALDNPQLEFFVPAYYRFLEQVRLGEYEHNLTVLAKLITGEVASENVDRDIGCVGRAAHKLHLLSFEELSALAHCLRIFDNPQKAPQDGKAYILTTRDFAAFPDPHGATFEFRRAHEMLHELNIRGLLIDTGAAGFGGASGYYQSPALREISSALRDWSLSP